MTEPSRDDYRRTPRTTVRRLGDRGRYDRETVHRILDEGLVCHVGFVADGQPFVVPMGYGRDGERLILHGSVASRLLRHLKGGARVCATVTHLDGLVLARSGFSSSMNYRSVMVLGEAREITEAAEKARALDLLADHLAPGRSREHRSPSRKELAATTVLELALEEVSAKARSGPPKDLAGDLGLAVWAGVLPLRLTPGEPEPAPDLPDGIDLPESVRGWRRTERS
jgi:hypothetical protein